MIQRHAAIPLVFALVVCAGAVPGEPVPATRPARPLNRFLSHFLSEMKGHVDTVNSLAISPDGRLVVSGSTDTTVRVWDLTAGKQTHCFEGHTGAVKSVAFSPDGKLVASGSEDNTARVWELATGRLVCQFDRASERVNCVAFSASGKSLLTGSCDMYLRVWSVAEDKLLRQYKMSSCVYFIAASKDDSHIACGLHNGGVIVLDGASGKKVVDVQAATRGGLDAMAITSDGSRLVTHGGGEGLAVWELPSGRQLLNVSKSGGARSLAIAPDGRTVALAKGYVETRDLTSGEVLRSYRAEFKNLPAAVFTPDGKCLVTGGELNISPAPRPADHCGIQVWDLALAERSDVEPSLYKTDPAGWTDLWPEGKLEGWNAYDWPPGAAAAGPTTRPVDGWTWNRQLGTFRSPPKSNMQWLSDRDYSDFMLHLEYRLQEHGKQEFQALVRMQPGQMACNSINVGRADWAVALASSAMVREGVVECQPGFTFNRYSHHWQSLSAVYPKEWKAIAPREKRPPVTPAPKDLGSGAAAAMDKPWNWNSVDVVVKGDTIASYANGTLVSRCTGVPVKAGRIGFFTADTDVELFNVLVKPLKP